METKTVLGAHPLVAFVATTDPVRAKAFYHDTLGLRLVAEELPFALVFDAQGTMLRVSVVSKLSPARFTVLGWHVPDVAAAVKMLREAGVTVERYEGMKQNELGIFTAPGGAHVAWFKDPDGNVLSLTDGPTGTLSA